MNGKSSLKLMDPSWEHEALAKVKVKVFRCSSSSINSISFCNREEDFLCCCDNGSVQLWNIADGSLVTGLPGHRDRVTQCEATLDGKFAISTSWDKDIALWDIAKCCRLWSNQHVGAAMCCSLSMDGKFAISGSDLDHSVSVWNTDTGKLVKKMECFKSTVNSCSFSSNAYRFCATSLDGCTRIIDMRNYIDELQPSRLLTVRGHKNIVSNAELSWGDRLLAVTSWDKTVSIWDLNAGTYRNSGATYLCKGHEGCISSSRFSGDGSTLVTSSYDSTLAVWDVKHAFKKFSLQGHTDWVTDCSVSKNEPWVLSASRDGTVRMWNISSADEIPVVVQNRKTIGLNVYKCDSCGEQFSTSNVAVVNHCRATTCVFCRLKRPSQVYSFGE